MCTGQLRSSSCLLVCAWEVHSAFLPRLGMQHRRITCADHPGVLLCLLQWEVYDAYIEDQERQRQQEELNRQKLAAKKGPAAVDSGAGPHSEDHAKASRGAGCSSAAPGPSQPLQPLV